MWGHSEVHTTAQIAHTCSGVLNLPSILLWKAGIADLTADSWKGCVCVCVCMCVCMCVCVCVYVCMCVCVYVCVCM